MWNKFIKNEKEKKYYTELMDSVSLEYKKYEVYPKKEDIFNAFKCNDVKVVILGQDPYHNPGQAHGLAFSVKEGVRKPPSLINIHKELSNDIGCKIPEQGDLTNWVKEGVFLLNTVLTVRKNSPNSHKSLGWETFTDNVIKFLDSREKPVVFILWGNNAKSKKKYISSRHMIIESVHPSPLSASRGFFGSKPFSRANDFLIKNNIKPINWCCNSIDTRIDK